MRITYCYEIPTPNRLPAGLTSARSLPTHHPPTGAAQYLSAGELTVLPTAPPTGASPYPHP